MITLNDLLALLPDNNTGKIDAVDMRTIVTELWNRDAALNSVDIGLNDRLVVVEDAVEVLEGLDSAAPSVPTGLASSAITATGFTVSWTAATDNVGVTGYEVELDGASAGTTTATSMEFTGKTSVTGYSVKVRARDAAGNWSAYSGPLVVTTAAAAGRQVSVMSSANFAQFNTPVAGTDGGGSLRTAVAFYRSGASLKVMGARVWTPPSPPGGFEDLDITVYLYTQDWTGNGALPSGAPVQSKAHTATRVKGAWTDVFFDAPVTVAPIAGGADGADTAWIAVQYVGGNGYVSASGGSTGSLQNQANDAVYLAEAPFYRQALSTTGGSSWSQGSSWYGLDIIAEV